MSKRVPSGCEKRKKKKEEQEKILKLPKINSFFSSAVPYEENTINSNITQPNTNPTALNNTTLNIIESFTTEPEHSSSKVSIIETFTPEPALSSPTDLDLTCRYPSDRGKFSDKVLDAQTKRLIMSFGPCKPDINFPRNDSNRKFSIEYYFMNTKSGFKIPRTWLCYSIILDMVYCETCWLFADRLNKNYYSNWVDGVNNWQHLAQKISKHESSTQHIEAVQVRSLWNKNKIIDEQLERQISEEADFWRNVLERIIKIILFLTTGNTALRGKEGKFGDCNKFAEGNFLRTVRLLADYDPVLNKLISNDKDCVKYLSHTIVNELIEILSSEIVKKICDEIRTTIFNFFSNSGPRWALLAFKSDISNEIRAKVLKKVCPTRWEARHDAVFALKTRFVDVLKVLTQIVLTSSKTNEKNLAVGLKKQIENREFVLILCLWEPILRALQGISKPLQNVNITLDQASNMLRNAVQTTQKLRNSFEDILKNASELCLKWGISTSFFNKRNIFAKKHYDELDGDYRLNVTEENFKVNIFLPTIDTVLSQLISRFEGTHDVADSFGFLTPTTLLKLNDSDIIKSSYDFVLKYENDITSDFARQLIALKTVIINSEIKTIKDLAQFIISKEVIRRWTNVRNAFAKFCKKENENKKSSSGAFKHKKYVYNDQLLFLKKIYIERDVVENFENDNNDTLNSNIDIDTDINKQSKTLDDEVSTQATPSRHAGQNLGSRSKKRKPDEIEMKMLKALEDEVNPNRHLSFFRGVLPALDKFDKNEHASTSQPYHDMMPVSYQSPQTATQCYPNHGQPSNSNTITPLNRPLQSISPAQSSSSCYSDIDFSTNYRQT
ncbi:hypothetical protein QTP88_001107 [Uroleucon formosanum]